MITVLSFRDKIPVGPEIVNATSRGIGDERQLSPFYLGPVRINGIECNTMENAWQYSKVYPEHVDSKGNPTDEYYIWRRNGYIAPYAHRYPMGKGKKPLYALLGHEKLDYIQSRKRIYIPLYAKAVVKTDMYKRLAEIYDRDKKLIILDFDAYDHRSMHMSWDDVINCRNRIMGHGFVLAMLLEKHLVLGLMKEEV